MNKIIIPLFLMVFFLASVSWAQPMMGAGKDKMPSRMERNQMGCGMACMYMDKNKIPDLPDLTDEQKSKLEDLRLELMKNVQPLRNQIAEKQAQLHTLSSAEEVNMSKINGLIEEIGNLRTEIMKGRERHHQAVRKILNEKQRLIFDSRPGYRHGMDD